MGGEMEWGRERGERGEGEGEGNGGREGERKTGGERVIEYIISCVVITWTLPLCLPTPGFFFVLLVSLLELNWIFTALGASHRSPLEGFSAVKNLVVVVVVEVLFFLLFLLLFLLFLLYQEHQARNSQSCQYDRLHSRQKRVLSGDFLVCFIGYLVIFNFSLW